MIPVNPASFRLFRPAIRAEPDSVATSPRGAAMACAGSTDSNLALTGDKHFLVSPTGDAFIMYQISALALPIAIDLGLHLVKYGEEARVDLGSFSPEGPDARALRYVERRVVREGAAFEVISAEHVPLLIPELRKVSDQACRQRSCGKGLQRRRF